MKIKKRLRIQRQAIVQLFLLFIYFLFLLQNPAWEKNNLETDLGREHQKVIRLELEMDRDEKEDRSDGDILKEITLLVEDAHRIDGSHFAGIEKIAVSREDIDFLKTDGALGCEGEENHVLGAIAGDTILLRENGAELNKRTLYHEIGHNLYRNFDDAKKEEWGRLFIGSENFVTLYAKADAKEDFAESFSCLIVRFDECFASLESKKEIFIRENVELDDIGYPR